MDRSELFSSLKLDRFIAFDFETTGLQVETDRAIEVAAIMFKDGKPAEKFVTLINPQIPISDLIADITGITNEMVTEAPLEKEIIEDFSSSTGSVIGLD